MSEKRDLVRIKDFDVEVIRSSKRKTASLIIQHGQLQLVVPDSLSEVAIDSILNKKRGWILRKYNEQKNIVQSNAKEYVCGECFTYLGKNHRLKVITGPISSVKLRDGYFLVIVPNNVRDKSEYIKKLITDWYINQAQIRLEEKTVRFAKIIGVKPNKIEIKSFKSRWGACNSKNDIQYNWKIIMAPHRIIDYVVIHELCHLLHHNHSNQFWQSVACYIPDYREQKEWLKLNGHHLVV